MAILPTGIGPVTGYNIERSLRFNSADSAYLNRTPGSAGNRKTWTWSGWVKRGALSAGQFVFETGALGVDTATGRFLVRFSSNDTMLITRGGTTDRVTTQVFRDVSAWYHVVVSVDTTQATADNRIKLYINGSQVTSFSSTVNPNQNDDTAVNSTTVHTIGRSTVDNGSYLGAYLTEVYLIDGQALTPSSFGETDAITGVWKPKAYTGTYGTNGFFLKFADNSGTTSTTLGKDSSGNGNNWTPNNFSVTAGVGNDSLVDTPTPYGTDTGAGGEVRGNYCTLNSASPLATGTANGNLQLNYNATNCVPGTIGVTTGKWYWEGLLTTQIDNQQYFGVANASFDLSKTVGEDANSWGMTVQSNSSNGKAQHNNVQSSSYATFGNGDICMVAYDMGTGKIWFGRNGTWFNSGAPASGTGEIYSNLSGTIVPMLCNDINSGGVLQVNFGQRPFAYTAPSGFKALCTQNLPTPAVVQGDDYFNAVLRNGFGTAGGTITTGFYPDFIWEKQRNGLSNHYLVNSIAGGTKTLSSNSTAAEATDNNWITAFSSTGYTHGSSDFGTGDTVAVWAWRANAGSTVSNTAGTITSTVSANTTSGFSIVTYTGNATAGATVGHGLGVAPSMIIVKRRDGVIEWPVYHISSGNTKYLYLNTTAAAVAAAMWNNTTPTSSVFTIGSFTDINANTGTYVAYCFAAVAGYSAFGSYTGNGNADGPFVYTGFRPRYLLIKATGLTEQWHIQDTARSTYNVSLRTLFANSTGAENTDSYNALDILSNGFKCRDSVANLNSNGQTYIYAAFAENPFKHSLAR